MSQATMRTALKTILDTVSNVGQTHNRSRLATDWSTFLDRFKTTISSVKQIRGWQIQFRGIPESAWHQHDGVIRRYRWLLQGFMGLDDSAETEPTFAALAEDVVQALDASATLHDGQTYYLAPPAVMGVFEERVFGGVLCHYVEITQEIEEYEAV